MKKVVILFILGVFFIFSCSKNEHESDVLDVNFTPCSHQLKATVEDLPLSNSVDVDFTDNGVIITYYGFEVTCDFDAVNVAYTLENGVLYITQQGSPSEESCICHTNVSYTINGINPNAVNVIFINGEQVYSHFEEKGVYVPTYEFPNGGGMTDVNLWKDGRKLPLSGINYVTSVFVSDNDIYVAGFGLWYAALWKNGKTQVLGAYQSYAHSVFVSNDDVYVVGNEYQIKQIGTLQKSGLSYFERNLNIGYQLGTNTDIFTKSSSSAETQYVSIAKMWKNGQSHDLTDGIYDAMAQSVYVAGDDVYIAGREYGEQGIAIAKLWKNGEAQALTDGSFEALAYSVCVSENGDIYVAGHEINANGKFVAKLWKNGEAIALTNGTKDGWAHSVFVSGDDVYVAGTERNEQGWEVAKLWKNEVVENLTNENYSNVSAEARSVYVLDGDVYVAGYVWNEYGGLGTVAKLWKNGVAQSLTGGGNKHGYAYSVFAK